MKVTVRLAALSAVLLGQHFLFAQISSGQQPSRPKQVSGQPHLNGFDIIRVSGAAGVDDRAAYDRPVIGKPTTIVSATINDGDSSTLDAFSEEVDLVRDRQSRSPIDASVAEPARENLATLDAGAETVTAVSDAGQVENAAVAIEHAVDATDRALGSPVRRTSWLTNSINWLNGTRSQAHCTSGVGCATAADCAPDAPSADAADCAPDAPAAACTPNAGCRSAGICDLDIFDKCPLKCFQPCDPCDPCRPCYSLWADALFLSPRDVGFGYAQHVDGPTQNASPLAPLNMVDPDYQMGFRVGAAYHPDRYSKISAQYWYFRSDTDDAIDLPGGTGFINALVTHPSTNSVDTDSLMARGQLEVDFDIVDFNFEENLFTSCGTAVDGVVGFRYAHLNQEFQGDFLIDGATTVRSATEFHGFGPRAGLKLRRDIGSCWHVYGEGFFDILAGQFQSDYSQDNIMVGNQVRSGFEDDRLVPQLEGELGIGWESACGNFSIRAGYYMGAWFNTVTTAEFIEGVRANNFSDDNIDESLTFDGLTFRALIRF